MTRGYGDDDDDPEVEDLLFLQYKNGKLVYAWYTEEDDDFEHGKTKGSGDFEGLGDQTTVKHVQLLSGKDYHVYVIANLDLSKNDYTYFPVKGDDDDDERGIVNIEKEKFANAFASESSLLNWRKTSSWGHDDDDKPVMFAVAANAPMEDGDLFKKVYNYTKMGTTFNQADCVNDVVPYNSTSVAIDEKASICATLYQPYAKVTFNINSAGLNEGVKIKVSDITIENCAKTYSLVNGYSLMEESLSYTTDISTREYTFSKGNSSRTYSSKWILENMAGVLTEVDNQKGKVPEDFTLGSDYDDAASGYTYIKVKGEYTEGTNEGREIIYRFILGKDATSNCNVERNVHYDVTMTLKGEGGVGEDTWRVECEGQTPDPEPEVPTVGADDFSRLDAHACVGEITFEKKDNKVQYIYIIVNQNESSINPNFNASAESAVEDQGGYRYNQFAGGLSLKSSSTTTYAYLNQSWGKDDFYKIVIDEPGEYKFKYRQLSWFDYNEIEGYLALNANQHKVGDAPTVASASPNSYWLHVYTGTENGALETEIKTIHIVQYPPIVVNKDLPGSRDNFSLFTVQGNYAYMERFDDDHSSLIEIDKDHLWTSDATLGTGWKIIDDNASGYEDQMFDYSSHSVHTEYLKSDYCYWANCHGHYRYDNISNEERRTEEGWDFVVQSDNDSERYIIPWNE